jgi:hypothetical protein
MPGNLPGWIELVGWDRQTKATGEYKFIEDRNEILEWAARRHLVKGLPTIVRELIEQGVPCWGRSGSWTIGTLNTMLNNPAFYGTRQCFVEEKVREKDEATDKWVIKTKKNLVATIHDHYPAVINDPDGSFRARLKAAREGRRKTKGKRSPGKHNLFRGIGFCGECGHPLVFSGYQKSGTKIHPVIDGTGRVFADSGKAAAHYGVAVHTAYQWAKYGRHGWSFGHKTGSPFGYLRCSFEQYHPDDCKNDATYRYDILEEQVFALIRKIKNVAPSDPADEDISNDDDETTRRLFEIDAKITAIVADLEGIKNGSLKDSPHAKSLIAEGDEKVAALHVERDALLRQSRNNPKLTAHFFDKQLLATYRAIQDAPEKELPELQLRLANYLARVIDRIVLTKDKEIIVHFNPASGIQCDFKFRMPPDRIGRHPATPIEPMTVDVPKLIGDIRTIFERDKLDKIPRKDLVAKLNEIEHRPWLRGTKHKLAALLMPLGIPLCGFRINGQGCYRGYKREQFMMEAKMGDNLS